MKLNAAQRAAKTRQATTLLDRGLTPDEVTAIVLDGCGDIVAGLVTDALGLAGGALVALGLPVGQVVAVLAGAGGELVDSAIENALAEEVRELVAEVAASRSAGQDPVIQPTRRHVSDALTALLVESPRGRGGVAARSLPGGGGRVRPDDA